MKRMGSAGLSVIEVMIGLAVLSFAASVLMIFASNLSDNVARANLDGDAERLMANIQHLLDMSGDPKEGTPTNPACATALKNGANPVTWDILATPNARGTITSIVQNGTVLAAPGMQVGPNLRINQMYLREPDPTPAPGADIGEGAPVKSKITVEGSAVQYDTVVAKLVVEFTVPNGRLAGGGAIPPRTADLNVAIDPGTKRVAFCTNTQGIAQSHLDCNNVATCSASPGTGCVRLDSPTRFDSSGNPVCGCQWVCPAASSPTYWRRRNDIPTSAVACDQTPTTLTNANCTTNSTVSAQQCRDTTSGGGCGLFAGGGIIWSGLCWGFRCSP